MGYGNKSINEYCEDAYNTGVDHGWYENGMPNVGERLALIHSEVSEALEFYRDGRDISEMISHKQDPLYSRMPVEVFVREDGKPDGFWVEIADVVIRCFDMAGAYGVDFESILKRKMEFNKGRQHKHGKIL